MYTFVFFFPPGAFEYAKVKFSHSPTMDMTSEILALISDLMRVSTYIQLYSEVP